MAELRMIDANALRNVFDAMHAIEGGSHFDHLVLLGIKKHIDDAPTIDAVPVVHGRWVHEQRYGDSGGWVWRCSACRREAISPIISALKYCHSCGAKMDGGASDGSDA